MSEDIRSAPMGQEWKSLFRNEFYTAKYFDYVRVEKFIEGLLASAPKPSVALDEKEVFKFYTLWLRKENHERIVPFDAEKFIHDLCQRFCRPALSEKAFDKKFPNGVFSLDIQSDDGSVCSHTNITEEVKEFLFYSPAISEKRLEEIIDQFENDPGCQITWITKQKMITAIRQELEK